MVTRSATTLKGKALQLLALRDYSRAELQAKLLRWLRTQTVKQAAQQASQQAKQMAGGTHMHAQAREHARGQPDVDADNAGYYLPDDTDDLSEHVLSSEAEASENHASELAQQHKQIAAVLDELQAKGWLDDRRAAEALLHQRSARLGHIRLRQVLQQKGIDADISQELLHAAAQTESERAHALWQKKFGTLPTTPAERARQMRFLASRGFSAAIIQRIMRHTPDDDCA